MLRPEGLPQARGPWAPGPLQEVVLARGLLPRLAGRRVADQGRVTFGEAHTGSLGESETAFPCVGRFGMVVHSTVTVLLSAIGCFWMGPVRGQ